MSKIKRRYSKRKKPTKYRVCNTALDRHHLFYQRRHYSGVLSELRNFEYCIVPIPKNTLHSMIHEFIGDIPTPKPVNARDALKHLRMLYNYGAITNDDDIERRLVILIALFECVEPSTVNALRQQLSIVREYKSSH